MTPRFLHKTRKIRAYAGGAIAAGALAVAAALASGTACLTAQRPPVASTQPPAPAGARKGDSAIMIVRVIPSIGGPVVARLMVTDTSRLERLVNAARDSVGALDALVNSARDGSDVTAINRGAGGAPVHVSRETLALLAEARRAWLVSGRRWDPTNVPLAEAIAAREQVGRVPSAHEIDSLAALTDFASVEISAAERMVRLPRPGMKIELDAVARGAALDLIRRAMRDRSVRGGLLGIGWYNLAFGRGPGGRKWSITLAAPRTGRAGLGVISIDSGAFVIASDSDRIVPVMDRHIRLVDLHTGTLAQGTAAVMVIARTAAEAGALAPAFYMLGPERAKSVADSMRAAVVVIREPQPGAAVGRGDVIVSDMADPYVELIRDVNPKVRLVPRPPPI